MKFVFSINFVIVNSKEPAGKDTLKLFVKENIVISLAVVQDILENVATSNITIDANLVFTAPLSIALMKRKVFSPSSWGIKI